MRQKENIVGGMADSFIFAFLPLTIIDYEKKHFYSVGINTSVYGM